MTATSARGPSFETAVYDGLLRMTTNKLQWER
jgi:hypothetical protein